MPTRASFYTTSKARPNIGRLLDAMERAGGVFTACLFSPNSSDITIDPNGRLIGAAMALAPSRGEEELCLEVLRPRESDLEAYGRLDLKGIPEVSELMVVVRMKAEAEATGLIDTLLLALEEIFRSGVMDIDGDVFLVGKIPP